MNTKEMGGDYPKMINIEIPYSEVKDKKIDFEWNGILLILWVWIIDDNDNIVKLWEFQFEET